MDDWKPTTAEVKHLRERTGSGWIACRDALIEAHSSPSPMLSSYSVEDIAVEILRVNRAVCV